MTTIIMLMPGNAPFLGGIEPSAVMPAAARRSAFLEKYSRCMSDPAFGWHFVEAFLASGRSFPVEAVDSSLLRAYYWHTNEIAGERSVLDAMRFALPQNGEQDILQAMLLIPNLDPREICRCYSTYYGGPGYEGMFGVAVDREGNAVVAGGTTSTNDFPTLNAWQATYGGGFNDGALAKFDPDGQLLFASYFGGIGEDFINAVALEPDGNIVIAGETRSVDLPTTDNAFQRDYAGGTAFGFGDGFIARISADGSQLLYCSYFGGSQDDSIGGLAFDSEGNLFLVGRTASEDLPLRNAFQSRFAGGENDGFTAKFDKTLTRLLFSTYIGGEDDDAEPAIALDRNGFIYLAGQTLWWRRKAWWTSWPSTPATIPWPCGRMALLWSGGRACTKGRRRQPVFPRL